MLSKTEVKIALTLAASLLLLTGSGCATWHDLGHRRPADPAYPVQHNAYLPKHDQVCVSHPAYFGYHATCWNKWPEGWIGCPPADAPPVDQPGLMEKIISGTPTPAPLDWVPEPPLPADRDEPEPEPTLVPAKPRSEEAPEPEPTLAPTEPRIEEEQETEGRLEIPPPAPPENRQPSAPPRPDAGSSSRQQLEAPAEAPVPMPRVGSDEVNSDGAYAPAPLPPQGDVETLSELPKLFSNASDADSQASDWLLCVVDETEASGTVETADWLLSIDDD
ncbi:MAG: hypothetical protein ACYTG0_33635 [Planctomycetota bacterium]|jgi:hypothetical protein